MKSRVPKLIAAIVVACLCIVVLVIARSRMLDEAILEMKGERFNRAATKLTVLANLGDSMAQFLLAELYAYGRGVSKDDELAIYWYRRARPIGPTDESYRYISDAAAPAMYYVGKTYMDGMGVKRDAREARRWFERSAKGGFAKAREELERAKNP